MTVSICSLSSGWTCTNTDDGSRYMRKRPSVFVHQLFTHPGTERDGQQMYIDSLSLSFVFCSPKDRSRPTQRYYFLTYLKGQAGTFSFFFSLAAGVLFRLFSRRGQTTTEEEEENGVSLSSPDSFSKLHARDWSRVTHEIMSQTICYRVLDCEKSLLNRKEEVI